MRIYWHLETMFSQLRLLINWSKFCPERASQPGEHWMSHWAQVTCSLPSLLCNLTSNNTYSSYLVHLKLWTGFLHFLDISISVSHTDCWIWVSAVTNPCHTVSVWSFQTVLSDPLLCHLQVSEIVKSQLPEVLVPLTGYICDDSLVEIMTYKV